MKSLNESWSRNAVMYQIYPWSFKDSNGDGIGDLKGIVEKLDYLNDGTPDSLGIGAIWLSPIYESPMMDFGYDISDYCDIDSRFGDLATFDTLVEEAHKRGIKIVMDFVLNHTSSVHPWFLESSASRENPRRDWYIWQDPKPDGSPPNNWLGVFGGSAWTYDEKTKQYYLHSFLPDQPDLNWRNPEVQKAMFDILRFWMKRGVNGFRSDAIHHLMKDEKFRDEPENPAYRPEKDDPHNSLLHLYTKGHPDLPGMIEKICMVLDEYEDIFMISETYVGIEEMKIYYRASRTNLHAPFNFNLLQLPLEARSYRAFIDAYDASLGPHDLPNYVLGNHDRPRLATRIGRDRARVAAMLLLTLRGLPTMYYGEEIGMRDVPIPAEKIHDPFERRVPGLGRDPERTPMQWDRSPHAGFSAADPWLPTADDYHTYNVETENKDPHSLLALYRRLIHYRNNSLALRQGAYHSLDTGQAPVFAYIREMENESLLILLNFSDQNQSVLLEAGKGELICDTSLKRNVGEIIQFSECILRPYEGILLKLV